MAGKLHVITGPSGVGKTTVAKELVKKRPHLQKLISSTTRPPREGEQNGVDYNFFTKDEFERLLSENAFFEHAEHYGNSYGILESDLDDLLGAGNDALIVVDVVGAKTIKDKRPDAILIFIKAESDEILLERLMSRDEGQTTHLEDRRRALEREMGFASQCGHQVTNKEGVLDETVKQIADILG